MQFGQGHDRTVRGVWALGGRAPKRLEHLRFQAARVLWTSRTNLLERIEEANDRTGCFRPRKITTAGL